MKTTHQSTYKSMVKQIIVLALIPGLSGALSSYPANNTPTANSQYSMAPADTQVARIANMDRTPKSGQKV